MSCVINAYPFGVIFKRVAHKAARNAGDLRGFEGPTLRSGVSVGLVGGLVALRFAVSHWL
jgi:hypothetical protein